MAVSSPRLYPVVSKSDKMFIVTSIHNGERSIDSEGLMGSDKRTWILLLI